jgi:uncharacterized protein YecT (DUF1311 family)
MNASNHGRLRQRARWQASMSLLLFTTASATGVVEGNIQGWKNPYVAPAQDAAKCSATQQEQTRCERELGDDSSRFLQELARQVSARIPQQQRGPFLEAEKYWLRFRDASCRYEKVLARAPELELAACLNSYNLARIQVLSKFLYCLSGSGRCSSDYTLYLIEVWQLDPSG